MTRGEERTFDPIRAALTGWWVIPLVLLATLASTAFFTSRDEPVYRTSVELAVVVDSAVETTTNAIRSVEVLERRTIVATFARVAATGRVRAAAAGRLGVDPSEVRRYRIDPTVVPSTNLIRIRVQGPDGQRVAAVADAVAAATVAEARDLYRVFDLRVLEAADVPRGAFAREPRRNYVVAGILGLFVAVAGALGVGHLLRTSGDGSGGG